MTGSRKVNPFVGPRPLEPGERIYGRDQEIRDLDHLVSAERIVLLHSPSGAGKSSLVRAGLLPRLRKSFDVWGPTRVNQEPPAAGVNRYVLSAVQGLEEGVPERLRRPAGELASQTLYEYFEHRPRRRSAPKNVLLLFDQFEEVLTVDPLAVDAKRAFFDQLGELLRDLGVWAIFALREDYLAPLDPYARRVPSHLRNRFRIDLLGLEGAREAMVEPARHGGREFPAAGKLVHDLATMKVQQADGTFDLQTGRHVEPVQLQVVCRRLWEAMPEEATSIEDADLARFGDVTQALAGYYADSVVRVAGGERGRERAIRDWFGEALIAPGGIRGQVLRGAEKSEGLANETVEKLLDTHLVRGEKRGGATWYELAHDRLLEPVSRDNAAWREEHLSEVQRRAALWERQDRPPGLLLAGDELAEGERWAATSEDALTEAEERFLAASREAWEAAEREKRQTRRIRRLGVAAMVVGLLALAAGAVAALKWQEAEAQKSEAERQRQEAVLQREEAVRQREEAERQFHRAEQERRAADTAREEETRQRGVAEEQKRLAEAERQVAEEKEQEAQTQRTAAVAARDDARTAQKVAEGERRRAEDEKDRADENAATSARLRLLAEAEALAVRAAGMTEPSHHELAALLALQAYRLHRSAGGAAENPLVYDAMRRTLGRLRSADVVRGHRAAVRSVAVSPDGATLASGGDDGEVRLTDLRRRDAGSKTLAQLGGSVRDLAWDGDGTLAAAGRGGLYLLDVREAAAPRVLGEPGAYWHALAFHPDGRLSAGGDDGSIRLFDPGTGEAAGLLAEGGAGAVRDLAWSADGATLAAASPGRGVLLWNGTLRILEDETDVRSVAWNADATLLAAATTTGAILLWDLSRPGGAPARLTGHTSRVEKVRFHPRRDLLASASFDATLRLWDARRPETPPLVLEGHDSWVWTVAFSPDGERLVSGGADRTLLLWTTSSAALAEEICGAVERNLTPDEWAAYLPAEVTYEKTCP